MNSVHVIMMLPYVVRFDEYHHILFIILIIHIFYHSMSCVNECMGQVGVFFMILTKHVFFRHDYLMISGLG